MARPHITTRHNNTCHTYPMDEHQPLNLPDRVACATEQMGMEMQTGVMTTRRFTELANNWADGDTPEVATEVLTILFGRLRFS